MVNKNAEANLPCRIIELAEIDSTNAEALRRAGKGEPGPLWIMAAKQTQGKGRSGRTWLSEPGNLHVSFLTLLDIPAAVAAQLSLVSGVAAIEAMRAVAPQSKAAEYRLKWPNDVLIGAAKVGGILVESMSNPERTGLGVVIGFGLNLASHPNELQKPATSLAHIGIEISPKTMLESLARELDHWLACWNNGHGFKIIREAWMERAGRIGERVSVSLPTGQIEGTYSGLDEEGALLVSVGDEVRRISYGDVTIAG